MSWTPLSFGTLRTFLFLAAMVATVACSRKQAPPAIDAAALFKNKCTSCHREVRKYREGKEATILRHMRVRGDLTEKETQTILRYLTQ